MDNNQSAQFDISSLAVNDTGVVELETTSGEPLLKGGVQLTVTVFGPGSTEYQRAQGKRNRAVMEAVRKGSKKMQRDDAQREIDATFLADCTASFNGFGYKDLTGYEMFKGFYLDPKIGYLAEQVNRALGDWGNFMNKATTP